MQERYKLYFYHCVEIDSDTHPIPHSVSKSYQFDFPPGYGVSNVKLTHSYPSNGGVKMRGTFRHNPMLLSMFRLTRRIDEYRTVRSVNSRVQ